MKRRHKTVRAYHIWQDDGCIKGVEITAFTEHRKLYGADNTIEIEGKEMIYFLTTSDDSIGYQDAKNFAIAHYNGLMQNIVLDLSELNRIGQLTRKGRKKPPDTNRGVEK